MCNISASSLFSVDCSSITIWPLRLNCGKRSGLFSLFELLFWFNNKGFDPNGFKSGSIWRVKLFVGWFSVGEVSNSLNPTNGGGASSEKPSSCFFSLSSESDDELLLLLLLLLSSLFGEFVGDSSGGTSENEVKWSFWFWFSLFTCEIESFVNDTIGGSCKPGVSSNCGSYFSFFSVFVLFSFFTFRMIFFVFPFVIIDFQLVELLFVPFLGIKEVKYLFKHWEKD